MEKQSFNCSFTAKISADDAIKKISDVSNWWGVQFSGKAEKQGDMFVIKMGDDAFFNCTVSELIPSKKVVWSVGDCHMPWYSDKKEWSNTKMIYEITEVDGESKVSFTHLGLTPEVECYKDCEPGWTHWIKTSLFSYLTTGKGVFRQPTK
jgi:hypothetical protein